MTLMLCLLFLLCGHTVLGDIKVHHRPRVPVVRKQNATLLQIDLMESPCKGKPLDFVFIIDSSRSVRPHDYEKVKDFISGMLRFLDVGAEATRVGLLQYGSIVQNEFSLRTFQNKSDIQRAVGAMVQLASGTMTGLALQYTMDVAFSQAEGARPPEARVPRVAMVITDGRPQDTVDEVAARARAAGIQIFAIGVGRVDMSTLRAIGSEPHTEHVYLVANFSQIEKLISVFQSKLCGGINLCFTVDHQCEHHCTSTPTSYSCRCRKGYVLNDDGKTCRAENACAVVEHGCEHTCVSLAESYECHCRSGYQLNKDGKTCSKIDQCALGTHGCQHECVNTDDSFICQCHKGYTLNPDGKTCKGSESPGPEIDQCALGTHGCQHKCVNTEDSFVCQCHKDYTLNPDGKTCKSIDQCALGTHGCQHECVNTEDSFLCRCRKGYTLNSDGKTCKKIDRCALGTHGCQHECVNTEDSFICQCHKGYTLNPDGKTCKKHDCRGMDVVFVIDGSKSLGLSNFELVKQFVHGIVDSLNVSSRGTQVGLLQYSTKVRTEFPLGRFSSSQAVKEAISRVQYMGRGSMTGSALRHMFEFSFSLKEGARPGVPQVGIVFTDGRSQDDVSKWAAKAREAGITMYAVGVGKAIEEELQEIASKPDEKHLYYAEDFSRMAQITDKLKSRICEDLLSMRLETLENSLAHK